MTNKTGSVHNDEEKMPEVNTTALVFLGIFSVLFLMTCILSVVKAVKDRKKIKSRIEAKRRLRLEQSAYENPENGDIHKGLEEEESVNLNKRTNDLDATAVSSDANSHSHVFRTLSADDIIIVEQKKYFNNVEHCSVSNSKLSSSVPDLQHEFKISPECLAVKKQIRRTSYAIAVDSHSWLPKDQPRFAKTSTIIKTYNLQPGTTKSYENRAFDPNDIQ
ncbi:uncharacterized protein LOC110460834 [Mizuhopecten yessoensis]|uniref:Uncharacterized protein n=1 Tax=Mizuhopecten yessoensis TaxID=6573 RepID=A0A210Q1M0_MIZYE|nr:uncharacterized protein LOC110460834 [Mizuhopecten yessoensis]OWF42605.1 hypothetical protein KP79_PYT10220 [Mizuhopecten yessoensis]